jgi:hypothetical protein
MSHYQISIISSLLHKSANSMQFDRRRTPSFIHMLESCRPLHMKWLLRTAFQHDQQILFLKPNGFNMFET